VDLGAVKEAPARELVCGAVAAARNARGLVEDAELLSRAGRLARAYSLAGLAVEEVGKADSLAALAAMPESLRARMKLVAGQLTAAVPFGATGKASKFATMPLSEVAEILDSAQAFAEDMDRLKQRGLYVDVDRTGRVREPSEVTVAEVREQLDRARRATSAVDALLKPGGPAIIACPGPDALEFSRAVVSAFEETRLGRSPEAAADVLLNAVSKLRS
jgi:AbiV family abortive infection protein